MIKVKMKDLLGSVATLNEFLNLPLKTNNTFLLVDIAKVASEKLNMYQDALKKCKLELSLEKDDGSMFFDEENKSLMKQLEDKMNPLFEMELELPVKQISRELFLKDEKETSIEANRLFPLMWIFCE